LFIKIDEVKVETKNLTLRLEWRENDAEKNNEKITTKK